MEIKEMEAILDLYDFCEKMLFEVYELTNMRIKNRIVK